MTANVTLLALDNPLTLTGTDTTVGSELASFTDPPVEAGIPLKVTVPVTVAVDPPTT